MLTLSREILVSWLGYLLGIGLLFALAPVERTRAATGAEKALSVVDYGALPDGETLATSAIQAAIDACGARGGGTVRFPAGTYVSGALRMKSSVSLLVEEGATLLGSRHRDDYYGPPTDDQGRVLEGGPVFRNLIHGENLHDVAVRGPGTIDGSGSAFRDKSKKRTKVIYLEGCRNVLVEDVRLKNAGSWMQHYRRCENLTIRNIDVFNHVSFNNDGLNIDSCRNVTITRCRIDSDDDGIVLKSLSDVPCRNIEISDCTVSSHCNALKMGTESGGGFVDVSITDCTVFSPKRSEVIYGRQRGLAGIALEIVDGGRMENVRVSGVRIDGVSVPIFLRLGNRARSYGSGAKPAVGDVAQGESKGYHGGTHLGDRLLDHRFARPPDRRRDAGEHPPRLRRWGHAGRDRPGDSREGDVLSGEHDVRHVAGLRLLLPPRARTEIQQHPTPNRRGRPAPRDDV